MGRVFPRQLCDRLWKLLQPAEISVATVVNRFVGTEENIDLPRLCRHWLRHLRIRGSGLCAERWGISNDTIVQCATPCLFDISTLRAAGPIILYYVMRICAGVLRER